MRPAPTTVYGEGLLGAGPVQVRYSCGRSQPFPLERYLRDQHPGDGELLRRCRGPVLDVGCGPGRLTSALARSGIDVLGVDVSDDAVAIARERGCRVVRASVFDDLPGAGWATALLADGNIGIGGDPQALLRRLRTLLSGNGLVLTELDAPGARTGPVRLRLEGPGGSSTWFRWAQVAADDIDTVAASAGLRVTEHWHLEDRWFAALSRA